MRSGPPLLRPSLVALLTATLAFAGASPASGADWTLTPDGAGDFPSIQAAIDAAADGDHILLENGRYVGAGNADVNFLGKAVTVRSVSGDPSACVVDCYWEDEGCTQHRGVLFLSGEGSGSVLEGVGVEYGESYVSCIGCDPWPHTLTGGGIYIEGASPTITDVALRHNAAFSGGGAMDIRNGSPLLTGCVFEANSAAGSHGAGGAVLIQDSASPQFEDCTFAGNRGGWGGAVFVGNGTTPTFRRCAVTGNVTIGSPECAGGAIHVSGSGAYLTIEASTVASNRTDGYGGGVFASAGIVSLDHVILHGNCAGPGPGYGADAWLAAGAQLQAGCSILSATAIEGPGVIVPVGNNVYAAPLLCVPLNCNDAPDVIGIFTLSAGSPALDAPGCGLIGGLGEGCGVAVTPESWGAIKARYR